MSERALEVAREAARAAGDIIRAAWLGGGPQTIEHKGRFDLVTDVDRRAEAAIAAALVRSFPRAALLCEEAGGAVDLDAEEVWVVDPLDGTTNFAHGYPVFCCSLAYLQRGEVQAGLVYDPVRGETFEALQGGGARLNGVPLRVSETATLGESLLATGFPYDRAEQPETNLERFAALTLQTRGVRRSGSAALDLCYTAAGRLDGYWELRLKPWDVAAGALLVREAGGLVTDLSGGLWDRSGREICASNGRLHGKLLRALAGSQRGPKPESPITSENCRAER